MGSAMEKVAILTDTECDIPKGFAEDLPIYVLPLRITDGVHEYRDTVDITVDDVYRRQKTENFKTSLPGTEDFEQMLDRIRSDGFTKVIALILSDGLSSAANVMRLTAKELTDIELEVISTVSASVGVGILAIETARLAVSGMGFEALKGKARQLVRDTAVFFAIDTLEYLKRGGRIGSVTEFIGNLLDIKPLITFNTETGELETEAKVRGRKMLKHRLIGCVKRLAEKKPGVPYNLVVCDGGNPEEGAALREMLSEAMPDHRLVLHGQVDATLAVHLGPNLLGCGVQFLED